MHSSSRQGISISKPQIPNPNPTVHGQIRSWGLIRRRWAYWWRVRHILYLFPPLPAPPRPRWHPNRLRCCQSPFDLASVASPPIVMLSFRASPETRSVFTPRNGLRGWWARRRLGVAAWEEFQFLAVEMRRKLKRVKRNWLMLVQIRWFFGQNVDFLNKKFETIR